MKITCFILLLLLMISTESMAQCDLIESRDADGRISARKEVKRDSEILVLPHGISFKGILKKDKRIEGYAYTDGFFQNTGFSEGLGKITVKGKNGFINSKGKIQITPQFDNIDCFYEGLAVVEINKKFGFIDRAGKIVIPAQFDYAIGFSNGLALVKVGEFWGFINKFGNFEIEPKFEAAASFSEGLARINVYDRNDEEALKKGLNGMWKWGFIDTQGNWKIPPTLSIGTDDFKNGIAKTSRTVIDQNGNFTERIFIDKEGRELLKLDIFNVSSVSEDLIIAVVGKDDKTGYDKYSFFDLKGNRVTEKSFDDLKDFSEGLAVARIGDWSGFINTKGDFVIEPKFWSASSFSEGLASVWVNGKVGFINREGKWVIKPRFDWADKFREGFCAVAKKDKIGYIDKSGNFIWKPTK